MDGGVGVGVNVDDGITEAEVDVGTENGAVIGKELVEDAIAFEDSDTVEEEVVRVEDV